MNLVKEGIQRDLGHTTQLLHCDWRGHLFQLCGNESARTTMPIIMKRLSKSAILSKFQQACYACQNSLKALNLYRSVFHFWNIKSVITQRTQRVDFLLICCLSNHVDPPMLAHSVDLLFYKNYFTGATILLKAKLIFTTNSVFKMFIFFQRKFQLCNIRSQKTEGSK